MEEVMDEIEIKKYSDYKDSGIEWLGEIPEHWQTLSNKYIFKLKKNLVGKKSCDYVLLSLTLNGVIKRDMENPQGKFPAEFDTYQEVKKGDFIFCLFDVEETPRCIGLSEYAGMITGAYTVLEPEESFNKKFLYYFYLNLDADKRLRPLYTGLRNTISKENFFSFKTFVPPFEEQTSIAQFLDRKTALIDQAIGIKEKQIELLKERRQILIHRAVTRGLNPDIKMKDSGVEWIGEIPESWEVKKAKYYFLKFEQGWSPQCDNYVADKEQWGVLKVGCVNGYKFKSLENKILPLSIKPRLEYIINNGDVLVSRANSIELVGSAAQVDNLDSKLLLCDKLYRIIINEKQLLGSFYIYLMQLSYARIFIESQANGASPSMQNIGQDVIRNMPLLVPTLNEQKMIVDKISVFEKMTVRSISLKQQEIEKLKEYKSILINSAVTGKINVFS